MPRAPRIDEPGLCHHVTARGIEKRQIYCDDRDRHFFLAKLGELAVETATEVYAFALIPNHFHLLVRRNKTPISIFMQRLLTAYALYFNKRHRRSGHLFQNRYKSLPCEDTAYFLQLIRYISLNPIRAGVVNTLESLARYPFSSHRYIVRPNRGEWLDAKIVLSFFGVDYQAAKRAYLQFVAGGLSAKDENEFTPDGLGEEGEPLQAPGLSKCLSRAGLARDLGSLMDEICVTHSLTRAELLSATKRRSITRARSLLAYRMASEIGLSGSEIGRRLSVTRSAVSKMIKRGGMPGFDGI